MTSTLGWRGRGMRSGLSGELIHRPGCASGRAPPHPDGVAAERAIEPAHRALIGMGTQDFFGETAAPRPGADGLGRPSRSPARSRAATSRSTAAQISSARTGVKCCSRSNLVAAARVPGRRGGVPLESAGGPPFPVPAARRGVRARPADFPFQPNPGLRITARSDGWSFLLRCSIAVIFGERKLCPGQVGHFGQDT